MAVILAEQEARRDHLQGSTGGAAFLVALDYTAAADVTAVHHVTSTNVDSVWIQAWNSSTAAVDLNLVLNPSDDTSTSAIDAVTVTLSIPAKSSYWVLQGESFRLRGSNTSTITAYTLTADVNKISLTGYVVRTNAALLY
tara:strand:+ start:50704 stop:51123 length:420 start_codon:yes stop_codon:yes gene_type:complete